MTQDQTTEETGRIALVTGASRGLGAALAEGLARRGFHVLAVARTVGGLEELDDRGTNRKKQKKLDQEDSSERNLESLR